jgi:high-affinity iron transporter
MTVSFLIGLREGLEMALVVTILVAFLVKTDRRRLLPLVWAGVGVAAVIAIGFGAFLQYTEANLSTQRQELVDAIASIAAVVFVTFMIFWMRRAARRMGGELRNQLENAIKVGPLAVVLMAFLSVAREGLETSILFFAYTQGASTAKPAVGLGLGVLAATVLGVLLYLGALRINLTRFFKWTGALLVLVAAGIFKYGVHDLQEANVLPGLDRNAFDISHILPADSWYAELLRGIFNITPAPSVLECVAWVAYGVPVLLLFLRPAGKPAAPTPAAPAEAQVTPNPIAS